MSSKSFHWLFALLAISVLTFAAPAPHAGISNNDKAITAPIVPFVSRRDMFHGKKNANDYAEDPSTSLPLDKVSAKLKEKPMPLEELLRFYGDDERTQSSD